MERTAECRGGALVSTSVPRSLTHTDSDALDSVLLLEYRVLEYSRTRAKTNGVGK